MIGGVLVVVAVGGETFPDIFLIPGTNVLGGEMSWSFIDVVHPVTNMRALSLHMTVSLKIFTEARIVTTWFINQMDRRQSLNIEITLCR